MQNRLLNVTKLLFLAHPYSRKQLNRAVCMRKEAAAIPTLVLLLAPLDHRVRTTLYLLGCTLVETWDPPCCVCLQRAHRLVALCLWGAAT